MSNGGTSDMNTKPAAKRIIILISAVLAVFALVNLFWYQFKYQPYKQKTVKMELIDDSQRPKYTFTGNGYVYTLKMPGYLSFESGYLYVVAQEHQDSASFVADEQGNLTERNVPHVDLFIWPQLFDHAQYRITVYEETESVWISVNSTGHFIPDKSLSEAGQFKARELYEKHQLEILNILDAAAWLWGSNI